MAEFIEYDWRIKTNEAVERPPKVDRKVALETLRNVVLSSDLKTCFPNDDATLTRFLNAKKYKVEEAFKLIRNYHWYRQKHVSIVSGLSLSSRDITTCISGCLPGVLPSRDRKGRCVLLFLANNWDYCTVGLLSIYRALLFTLEYLLEDVRNQTTGFVVIIDWTEFTFKKTTHFSPSVLKLMVDGLQNCFPARFKGVHFLGQPWYVEAALMVIKPFLNEKIKERIFMHGNNMSNLHEHVHKDILPAELGGEQPSYNPEQWIKTIESKGKIL